AHLARRGGDLGPDPAGPEHRHRAAAAKPRLQRLGVLDRAQVVDAVEAGPRDRRPARLGAGGEQDGVVAQALAALELDLGGLRVEGRDRGREAKLDLALGVEVLLVDVGLAVGLAAQIVLGERRALVGSLRFGADQNDAAVEALLAQGLGRLGAGEAGADDDEGSLGWHCQLTSWWSIAGAGAREG